MKRLIDALGDVSGVITQSVHVEEPFADMAARFAHRRGSVVLLSGGEQECARHHILGLDPWLSLCGRFAETTVVIDGKSHAVSRPSLEVLETIVARCRLTLENNSGPVAAGLFGFSTFPVYSVSAAHANDFATSEQRVELSAALMFWYAMGAIPAPYLASTLIRAHGPAALFGLIAVGHLCLIVFGLTRMRARPTPEDRTHYVYAPRTSFTIGKLLKRSREGR